MDIKTVILTLAIGNFIFGLTLILYQFRDKHSLKNPFLPTAKFLQAIGWILLVLRGVASDFWSLALGNICLLSGFAYECWAMFRITGRPVNPLLHLSSLVYVISGCIVTNHLPPTIRVALGSSISVPLFLLSGWAMLRNNYEKSLLRIYIGGSMLLLTAIVTARAILSLPFPVGFSLFSNNTIQLITFSLFYYMMLTNGFGMLLLTKEKTDEKLKEVMDEQKAILDTLPTGLCILRDRVIEQCNPALEVMFGFASGELLGKSVRCLYENDELYDKYGREIYSEIEKKGHFNGEVNYIRRNGEQFWAKDMGAIIFHERPQSHAVFCITDISEQKKQQQILASKKEELEETLTRIKRLEGILSICMCCKKIRAGEKSWDQLEKYITEHADVHFSHGICPDCYEKYKEDEFRG